MGSARQPKPLEVCPSISLPWKVGRLFVGIPPWSVMNTMMNNLSSNSWLFIWLVFFEVWHSLHVKRTSAESVIPSDPKVCENRWSPPWLVTFPYIFSVITSIYVVCSYVDAKVLFSCQEATRFPATRPAWEPASGPWLILWYLQWTAVIII